MPSRFERPSAAKSFRVSHGRSLLVVPLLVAGLVLVMSTLAVAGWSDLNADLLAPYGITKDQVAAISQGYADGTWAPAAPMPRRQFTRLAVNQFAVTRSNPAEPTFTDVLPTDSYFADIEGAVAAGLVKGVGGGIFGPDLIVSRQQGVAIIARYLSSQEGVDLVTLYPGTTAADQLAEFNDGTAVSAGLLREVAFAVDRGILRGSSSGALRPGDALARIQGAALLIRAASATTTTSTSLPSSTTPTTGLPPGVDTTTTIPLPPGVTTTTTTTGDLPPGITTTTSTTSDVPPDVTSTTVPGTPPTTAPPSSTTTTIVDPDGPPTPLVGIRGTVVDADTGDPLAGVTVTARGKSTTTGADGTFSLAVDAVLGDVVLFQKTGFYGAQRTVLEMDAEGYGLVDVALLSLTSPDGPPSPPGG